MTHPYAALENARAWAVIDSAVSDLVKNQDLAENTARHYIVGYIVKRLADAGFDVHQPPATSDQQPA
jgi:hypothetical protein